MKLSRTMNKIVFDQSIAEQRNHHEVFAKLNLPPEKPQQVAPEFGQIQIPPHRSPCCPSPVAVWSSQPNQVTTVVRIFPPCPIPLPTSCSI